MKRADQKGKPGVIFYTEWLGLIKAVGNENAGILLIAALHYTETGEIPAEFDNQIVSAIWDIMRSAFDADTDQYLAKCDAGGYAAYQRTHKESALSFEEWKERYGSQRSSTNVDQRQPTSTNVDKYNTIEHKDNREEENNNKIEHIEKSSLQPNGSNKEKDRGLGEEEVFSNKREQAIQTLERHRKAYTG